MPETSPVAPATHTPYRVRGWFLLRTECAALYFAPEDTSDVATLFSGVPVVGRVHLCFFRGTLWFDKGTAYEITELQCTAPVAPLVFDLLRVTQ